MKFKFSINSNLKPIKTYLALVSIVLLSGCVSMKPATTKSGKNLFETFFVGESGTQYFIKPLTFINSQSEDEIDVDFTFRYKNEIKDSVTVNLSLLSPNILKNIDSLTLTNTNYKIVSTNVKLLFNEKARKLFKSRFSTQISLLDFTKMFKDENWEIIIHQTETTYTAGKKTQKAIKGLQNQIFILF